MRALYILLGEGAEGVIELNFDQIPGNHVYEPDVNTSHHSDGQEDIDENFECPECCDNFKTKCDLRTHVGR